MLIYLLLSLAQQEDAELARKLFLQMDKKIRSAESIDIRFETNMRHGDSKSVHQGRLVLKKGNKYLEERKATSGGEIYTIRTWCDGSRLVGERPGTPLDLTKAKKPTAQMYESVALSMARVSLEWHMFFGDHFKGADDIAKNVTLSNFSLGQTKSVNGRDIRLVNYTVEYTGNKNNNTVWIDVQSHLPVKRIYRDYLYVGEKKITIELEENFLSISLDSELEDSLFELPKGRK